MLKKIRKGYSFFHQGSFKVGGTVIDVPENIFLRHAHLFDDDAKEEVKVMTEGEEVVTEDVIDAENRAILKTGRRENAACRRS